MVIKSVALGALMLIAATAGAVAQTVYPAPYRAPAAAITMLPEVVVPGRAVPSSPHYRVPAGYDANVAMHPYTSGLGPCTEGAVPSQGCHNATSHPIPPSHYERPPFIR